MPVLAEVHVFPVFIAILCSKVIFSYNFTVFMYFSKATQL